MSTSDNDSREHKIKDLIDDVSSISTENVDKVCEYVYLLIIKERVEEAQNANAMVDKKVTTVLKILNDLLKVLDRPEITSIIDFTISRPDILSQKAIESIESNYEYAFKNGMKKRDCVYSERSRSQSYQLTFLRHLVKWADINCVISYKTSKRGNKTMTSYFVTKDM